MAAPAIDSRRGVHLQKKASFGYQLRQMKQSGTDAAAETANDQRQYSRTCGAGCCTVDTLVLL